ncbi:hypothetical protein MASR2M15_27560 [Anaerolineales bacterium]
MDRQTIYQLVRSASNQGVDSMEDLQSRQQIVAGYHDFEKLVGMGSAILPILGDLLLDKEAEMRVTALSIIKAMNRPEAKPYLRKAYLQESNERIFWDLTHVLHGLGDGDFCRDPQNQIQVAIRTIRYGAVCSLSRKGLLSTKALGELSADPDGDIRYAALSALVHQVAKEPSAKNIAYLIPYLKDEDERVKILAFKHLPTNWQICKNPALCEAIVAGLESDDIELVRPALHAVQCSEKVPKCALPGVLKVIQKKADGQVVFAALNWLYLNRRELGYAEEDFKQLAQGALEAKKLSTSQLRNVDYWLETGED